MSESKDWIKGRGAATTVPTGAVKLNETDADRASAAGAVASVVSGVVASSHEDRLIRAMAAETASGATTLDIKRLADAAGVSVVFANFFLSRRAAAALPAYGMEIVNIGSTAVEVKTTGAVAVPTPAPAVASPTTPTVAAAATAAPTEKPARARAAKKVAKAATPEPAKPTGKVLDVDYFHFDPVIKTKIKAALRTCQNIWLAGDTGCGKSEYFERILEERGQEKDGRLFMKVSFNGESSTDDLLGHYVLRGGETVWIEGALPKAMKLGLPLICEELDAAPAEANLAMQRALEIRAGKARAFYNPRNGESVEATEGFVILATANSTGGGDHSGLYAGVQLQNAAFRDRFSFERVTYLKAADEKVVIERRTGLDSILVEKAVEFANAARQALKNGSIFTPVSTRTLVAFGNLTQAFLDEGMPKDQAVAEAMKSAIIYKSGNPTDEEALIGMVQRIFGFRSR